MTLVTTWVEQDLAFEQDKPSRESRRGLATLTHLISGTIGPKIPSCL